MTQLSISSSRRPISMICGKGEREEELNNSKDLSKLRAKSQLHFTQFPIGSRHHISACIFQIEALRNS